MFLQDILHMADGITFLENKHDLIKTFQWLLMTHDKVPDIKHELKIFQNMSPAVMSHLQLMTHCFGDLLLCFCFCLCLSCSSSGVFYWKSSLYFQRLGSNVNIMVLYQIIHFSYFYNTLYIFLLWCVLNCYINLLTFLLH